MADGSVRLDVSLSISKAEKELDKLNSKIDKVERELAGNKDRRNALLDQIREVGAQLDEANYKVKELRDNLKYADKTDNKDTLREQLAEAVEEQRVLNRQANSLNTEYDRVNGRIQNGTANLEEMTAQAGEMQRAIDARRPAEALNSGIKNAKAGLMTILKYGLGIRSIYRLVTMLRNGIKEGFKQYMQYDAETKANVDKLKNSIGQLKGAWGAAFAPIVNAVIPILMKLINWLISAGNAVARFVAIVSGKSTYQKAVGYTEALADGLSDVSEEAKEAKKFLMGIDELTIWSDDKSSASSSNNNKAAAGGTKYETTPTNAGDMSFASRLGLTIKDVFCDWGDWNAEKIMQKIIAFAPAVAGASLGWKVGGFKGAVIGGLLGLSFGLVIDANSFNGDGKLDIGEIIKSIIPVGATLVLSAAGHPIIGIAVGLSLSFFLEDSEVISATIDDMVDRVKKHFNTYIDKHEQEQASLGMDTDDPVNHAFAVGAGIVEGIYQGMRTSLKGPVKGKSAQEILAYIDGLDKEFANAEPGTGQYTYYMKCRNAAVRELEKAGVESATAMIQGTEKGLTDNQTKGEETTKSVFARIVEAVKNFLGIHSPSTVFAGIGNNIVQGFLNGITERWNTTKENIIQKFEDLRTDLSGIVDRIKGLFNFQFRIPKLKLPHLSVTWEKSGNFAKFFGVDSIPHLSVEWYARGGIVKSPTLFGAGEAGKEAIIPLERNTEWINTVADGIIDRITQNNILNRIAEAMNAIPMPAMAYGNVVPPNARGSSQGITEESLTWLIAQITNAVYGSANLVTKAINDKDTNLSIDGMWAARRLYQPMQEVASEHGNSMIRGIR